MPTIRCGNLDAAYEQLGDTAVPTVLLVHRWTDDASTYFRGEADGVNPSEVPRRQSRKFTGPFERIAVSGVSHSMQRERDTEFASILAGCHTGERPGAIWRYA